MNKGNLTQWLWTRLAILFLLSLFSLLLSANPTQANSNQQTGEQAPGPVAILTAEDMDAFTFVRPSISPDSFPLEGRAVTFNITYVGFPPAAEAAFQYAADIWAGLLTSSQTVNVTANWVDLPGSTLGSAGPTTIHRNFAGAPFPATWYPVALGESIFGGNLNTAGSADINANFDSMGTNWYFGTDGNPGAGQYDLVSVVLHELGHGLGFTGFMRYDNGTGTPECSGVSGQGCWGTGSPINPLVYDRFTEDNGGTALLNTGVYPNPSIVLGTALTSNSIFFDGPLATVANGGSRVPLYAPGSWTQGSSYSHLNESSYPAGNLNSLMTPQIGSAEAIHDPGQVTLCMFADMGWDAFCNPSAVWDGGGATNDWSDADNWDTDLVPGSTTEVTFNGTSTKDAVIDASFPGPIATLTIDPAYTGTITQMDDLSLTGSLLQSGGTFTGSTGTLAFLGGGSWSTTAASNFGDVYIGGQTVTLASDVRIGGSLTIGDGALLDAASFTIRLGGDWLEQGFGFIPGTSTVIFEGSGQTVDKPVTTATLIDEDFSVYDGTTFCTFYPTPPSGWVREVAPGGHPNGDWLFGNCPSSPNNPDTLGHARRWWDAPIGSFLDAWIHSPQVTLSPQATYTLTFNYAVSTAADPSDFYAHYGDGQSAANMTTQIFVDTNANNTTWTTAVVPFSVPDPGSYHIGLQNTDPFSNEARAGFDDIVLTGSNPLSFYNLTIEGDTTAFNTDVFVENDLTVSAGGRVDFGGNEATVEGTVSNSGVMYQTLDAPGSATTRFMHITDAAGTTDKYYGVDITPDAGMGSTTVTLFGNQANCSTNPADELIGRCFDISPATPANAAIRFWFTEAERNGREANALVLWRHNGTNWETAGDSYTYSEAGTTCTSGGGLACWFQAENINSYSPFVPGATAPPTAIVMQSAGVRAGWTGWWLLAAPVLLLVFSGILVGRRRKM